MSAPDVSSREARKLEQSTQRAEASAAKDLDKALRKALREEELSAESRTLLEAHPEEAERLRGLMAKAEARKQQVEANATETEEDEASINAKIAQLAQMVRAASHVVLYTGAGLSTAAAIPDYRGPNGLWTLAQKKGGGAAGSGGGGDGSGAAAGGGSTASSSRNAPCAARQAMGMSFAEALPTSGHMAIAGLVARGHVQCVISQNVDGLHLRSGVPQSKLCELHGNVFRERCPACGKESLRGFDVTGKSAYHRHGTERCCERPACAGAQLRDTIVYFGEKVHNADLERAREHSEACDLAICLGSSLKVLTHYAYIWQPPPKPRTKRFIIVNLQPTPRDRLAELRLFGKCDDVLSRLLAALKVAPPSYSPNKDVVHKLALKLPPPAPPVEVAVAGAVAAAGAVASASAVAGDKRPAAGSDGPDAPSVSAAKMECEAGGDGEGGGEEETEDADEGGVDDTAAAADADGAAPRRKRRRKAMTHKRKAMPRAFPAGRDSSAPPAPAPVPPADAPPPPSGSGGGGVGGATLKSPMGIPPPLTRSQSPASLTRAHSAEGGRRGDPSSSPPALAAAAPPPPPLPEADGADEAGPSAPPPLSARARKAASPAPATVAEESAQPLPAAPKPKPAAPKPKAGPAKCAAKCGFFAVAGGDHCSKCAVKREAEFALWNGVLSKKKR